MEYKDLKDQACRYVDELKPVIYGIAESLHDHPETGMNEVFASATLKKILQDRGFAIDNPVADAFTLSAATVLFRWAFWPNTMPCRKSATAAAITSSPP